MLLAIYASASFHTLTGIEGMHRDLNPEPCRMLLFGAVGKPHTKSSGHKMLMK